MKNGNFLFTSESVSEGHPDKIADQIVDSILDAILTKDKDARVACECFIKGGMVLIGGEITTNTWVDMETITRECIRDIGYCNPEIGFDYQTCAVILTIGKQSPDIAQGIKLSKKKDLLLGAGDQGIMFGYATDENDQLMPTPIMYAHQLMLHLAQLRKSKKLKWLRPDAKSQVTIRYKNHQPHSLDCVLISTQHDPDIDLNLLREAIMEELIKPIFPKKFITPQTKYIINPSERFVIGGPLADSGLSGRKLIVDSYGGMARCGGGAFSGKDPTKVDRTASYMARYIAKNIVDSGLAKRCEIQLAYGIGIPDPLAIYLNSFNSGKVSDEKLIKLIKKNFDLSLNKMIKLLDLQRPIYKKTATYGHFGRNEKEFTWEITDKIKLLEDEN